MAKELENLPTLFEAPTASRVPIMRDAPPLSDEAEAVPLNHYLWIIRRQAWKIALFVITSLLATFLITSRLTPIYEAISTINIDRQAPSSVLGTDSQKEGLVGDDLYVMTQMKIIESDAVLRPVARKFNLIEREAKAPLTPAQLESVRSAPTVLKQLHVNRPTNTLLINISYRSTSPQLSADVANAIAQSYLENIYRLQATSATSAASFMTKQLDELKAKMERSGQALAQFERELNVINPEQKTTIMSARLLQLNTEYTNAQADRVKKEAIFNSMKSGSLAAEQISGQGEDLQRLQERLNQARENFAQIKASKGPNHPDYKKAQSQLDEITAQWTATREQIMQRVETDFKQAKNREMMLQDAVSETKSDFDKLNSRSFEYQRLKDDADADKKLYDQLLTSIQQAGINAGFQNKSIVISDLARPQLGPVFPKKLLNLAIAGLLSALFGIAAVLLLDALDTTVRDPEQVHRLYQTELIGVLPQVRDHRTLMSTQTTTSEQALMRPDASNAQSGPFNEGVRMLRNSILLSDFDRRLRSLLFTSATPGEGKSTVALHVALAHSEQGKKTLLIDADLRRPTLDKRLGLSDIGLGLSGVLVGDIAWQDAIVQLPSHPNLSFLPAGAASRRMSDLVGTGIPDILDEAISAYDLVILDGPPILGFAEPMQLAIAVDGVVIIAVAGETNRKAVGSVVATLRRLRANLVGIVLNRMSKGSTSGYYYYRYYDYYKNSYSGEAEAKGL